jgi:hypothetical protein
MNTTAPEATSQAVTVPPASLPEPARSPNESAFSLAVRRARALCSSTLVPNTYQGEDNLGNAMIALDIADRTGMPPLMVMQHLYIVHGKPGWSATFLIATVNACGRFTPLRFETDGGDNPAAKSYRVRAVARDKATDETLRGTWITWAMADGEGWSTKKDSKWKTMPEQMFMYRAAAFWTRAYAPELSLGLQTADELQDVHEGSVVPVAREDLVALQSKLQQRALTAETPATEAPADAIEAEHDPEREPERDADTGEVLPDELQSGAA